MALSTLLAASAEPIAAGVISQLRWTVDTTGRSQRQPLTQRHRDTIRQRVEARAGRTLTGAERRELNQIVDATDNATRRGRQLDRDGRLPRPSEIERLPGMGNRGGDSYSYTSVVTVRDRQTGQESTYTHVVTSRDIITGDEVRRQVLQAVGRGDVIPRSGTNPPRTGGTVVQSVHVLSVYRGAI